MILLINYSHKWWYKVLSVLLVVALILVISFGAAPRAHAVGVLTVTVCAAILAVMAGAGIATVVSGMTSADIQNWMTGKLNEWDTYRNDGNVFTDLIQNNLITTTVKGALAIGNAAARGISDFINWLKTDLGLSDNSSIVVSSNYYYVPRNSNATMYVGTTAGDSLYFSSSTATTRTAIVYNGSANIYVLFSDNPFTAYYKVANGSIQHGSSKYGNPYYYYTYAYYGSDTSFLPIYSSLNNAYNDIQESLSLNSDVINIPSVADDGQTDIVIGIDGVYPGATADEAADVIMDGVLDNTLDTTMTVTDEYVDAVEAVVINEQPISVNTDHHMIGFTNLPDFVNLNLNSIWHYVSDAVEYASGFISWFVNLLSSVPTLAIPLYMSFTLLIVLSFIRRILL